MRVLDIKPADAGVPVDVHVVSLVDGGVYACESRYATADGSIVGCGFEGDLPDALAHAVSKQFRVQK